MERFSALVLSRDGSVLRVIHRACEENGVETKIVGSIRDANELLKDKRFDLAVCDCDFPAASELAYLDPRSAWRGMVFALVRQEQPDAMHGRRVHVTLSKPLTERIFSRGLRAAYTTMVHERRAAFRYALDVPVSWAELVQRGERRDLGSAKVLNISRTGMCLETSQLLPQQATVQIAFELPPHGGLLNADGEVVWSKSPGESGIRFNHLPAASQKRLTEWLEAKLPREFV